MFKLFNSIFFINLFSPLSKYNAIAPDPPFTFIVLLFVLIVPLPILYIPLEFVPLTLIIDVLDKLTYLQGIS